MTNITHQNQNQSLFDQIRRVNEQGYEFWRGRELMDILGYKKWQHFKAAIEAAMENLEALEYQLSDHFLPEEVKPEIGRPRLDYRLSRYAVEEIYKNTDSRTIKPRSKSKSEHLIKKELANRLDGKKEVNTLVGNIDVLTTTEIIEIKRIESWKHAVGQVLIYSHYYPSHQKRIHLYGETQEAFLDLVEQHCYKLGITVTWESGE